MKAKHSLYALAVLMLVVALAAACNKPARTDAQIASDVQGKIYSDPSLQGRQIAVQSSNGVVTLSGYVNNDAERMAASNDAGAIEGVKQVLNTLQVQQAQQPEPVQPEPAQVSSTSAPRTRAAKPSAAPSRSYDRGTSSPASNTVSSYNAPQSRNTAPSAPAAPQKITLPDGTQLSVRLVDGLDSERNQIGDTFRATLNAPITIDDNVIVPENADVEGRVVDVKSAGRFAGQSALAIELTKLEYGGRTYQIHTNQWSKQGSSRGKSTVTKVGIGAGLGAIIGGIAAGGKGAAIGATAGAGAGTGAAAITKGQQITLGSEALLNFQLESPLTVTPSGQRSRQPMNQ